MTHSLLSFFMNPNMQTIKLSAISRLMLVLAAVMLVISIFVPIWQIDLQAPQYPEGLTLLIYSNDLGGNVDIINGLNHYIGMHTLHTKDFIEFSILPYIIGAYALLSLAVALLNRWKALYVLLAAFILFGVIAMIDFYRWEYNYGHNLDPNAAIIVPGMAYQPPLIGYKQLLNFAAYSVPAIGGWLFIVSGLLMLLATLFEAGVFARFSKKKAALPALLLMFTLMSCGNDQPEPIKLNADACDFCKMTISNGHLAAELKTDHGRAYKFDDIACMIHYIHEKSDMKVSTYYVCDYVQNNILMNATNMVFLRSEAIESPMGGNTAAFKAKEEALPFQTKWKAKEMTWAQIIK